MCYCGVVCCVCVCVCLRGWDIIADGGKIDNDSCIRACRRYNDWNTINQDLITRCHIMYIESGNIKYTPMLALTQFWPRVHRARNAICLHDDVIKWKHFPRYCPFVRGIHRSPVNSHHKGQVTRSFEVFFDLCLNKRLYNPSRHWWFETPSRPLCRLCNVGKSGIGCWNPLFPPDDLSSGPYTQSIIRFFFLVYQADVSIFYTSNLYWWGKGWPALSGHWLSCTGCFHLLYV